MRQLGVFPHVEQAIIEQRALLDGYDHGRGIGLFWMNGASGIASQSGPGSQRRFVAAIHHAQRGGGGLGLNIFNRQADKLYMCNIAQMVNVLQSVLLTDGPEGKNCVRTTTYYAFMLFKAHRGKTAVRVEGGTVELRRAQHSRLECSPYLHLRFAKRLRAGRKPGEPRPTKVGK